MDSKEYVVEYMLKLDENKTFIRIHCNGRAFDIKLGPEDLRDPERMCDSSSFEQQYLDLLRQTFSDDEDEDNESIDHSEPNSTFDAAISPISSECCCEEDPMTGFILRPFLTHGIFKTFASKSSTPCLTTLQDVLHPPLLSFSLRVVDGDLVPIHQMPEEGKTVDPPWAAIGNSQHWLGYPSVRSEEIKLARTHQNPSNTNLVMFNDRVCWFKPVLTGVDNLPYIREIDTLFNLSREKSSQALRIPQLEAVVLDGKNGDMGFINGLILSAVYPNRGTLADLGKESEKQPPSITLRERWYSDIERMLQTMHSKGFVWGDVSPNNVIIDEEENVWIVDFGGGYTEGWIEPENMETMRGDLEGLKRIKEYLLDMDQKENALD